MKVPTDAVLRAVRAGGDGVRRLFGLVLAATLLLTAGVAVARDDDAGTIRHQASTGTTSCAGPTG